MVTGHRPRRGPASRRRGISGLRGAWVALPWLVAGCGDAGDGGASPSGSASSSAAPDDGEGYEDRLRAMLEAEQRRSSVLVLPEDLSHRAPEVRRAAARALAQIGDDAALPGLGRALTDHDPEVVRWAGYGLGFWCKADRERFSDVLAARALTLLSVERDAAMDEALATIVRAIGSCAAKRSEELLAGWLSQPPTIAVAAALGLGDVASVQKRLREDTVAALLNLAAGSAARPAMGEAFFPIGRVERVPLNVVSRLLEVATQSLDRPGPTRFLAIRALGRAGRDALPELGRVASDAKAFDAAERAEALRNMGRFEASGQKLLAELVVPLRPSVLAAKPDAGAAGALVSEDFNVFMTLLGTLEVPGDAQAPLREVASATPPDGASRAVLVRYAWARCRAASLLAGKNFRDPLLAGCDVAGDASPAIGARALVEVLDRGPLTGARAAAWRTLAESGPLRAREAALELLEKHLEAPGAHAVLAKALEAPELGVAGTAASVIAKQPLAASDDDVRKRAREAVDDGEDKDVAKLGAPDKAVTEALGKALAAASSDPEVQASVMDAMGAIALKVAVPALEKLCADPSPTLREHAASALALLAGKPRECAAAAGGGDLPPELGAALPDPSRQGPVQIEIPSDVGMLRLELDATRAPVTVARVAGLVEAGYYDGNVVHRVVPGFVTQFGAPQADGYGGPPGKPSLRCETSPQSFAPMTVGLALAGRDTGSSQLFVMHAYHPHLDGRYPWLGTASGPWDVLVDGDAFGKPKVVRP